MPRGVDRLDAARLQRRLWTPASNAGQSLKLWLDAADLSTLTLDSSGRVSAWADKSGLGNHAVQATAGARPYYRIDGGITGFRGLPSIFFDNFMSTAIGGNVSLTGTVASVYAVATLNVNTAQFGRLISLGLTGAADFNNASYFNISREGINSTVRVERASASSTFPVTFDVPFVLVGQFDGTNGVLNGNGKDQTPFAQTAALNVVNYQIGQQVTGGDYWAGYINELIVDAGPFSVARRERFVGSLAQKWRCPTILYAAHPYRNDPPLIGA